MTPAQEKARESLRNLPQCAKDALRRVLSDPELPKQIASGAAAIVRAHDRSKEVGWLVAIAEIEDPTARVTLAKTLTDVQRVVTRLRKPPSGSPPAS